MLTTEDLRTILRYNPESGQFHWIRPPTPSKVKIGDRAGTLMSDGYRSITINRKMHKEHRLAWLYMTGEWPSGRLDHENRMRDDNRFSNLRPATYSQNAANRHSWSKYGLKGISPNPRCKTNPWRAAIERRVNGQRVYKSLGVYKTMEEAHQAYLTALREFHPEHAAP